MNITITIKQTAWSGQLAPPSETFAGSELPRASRLINLPFPPEGASHA